MRVALDLIFCDRITFRVTAAQAAEANVAFWKLESARRLAEIVGLELLDCDMAWLAPDPETNTVRVELRSKAWRERAHRGEVQD